MKGKELIVYIQDNKLEDKDIALGMAKPVAIGKITQNTTLMELAEIMETEQVYTIQFLCQFGRFIITSTT